MGFQDVDVRSWMEPRWNDEMLAHYQDYRDFPAREGTSQLGVHLRFGTVSIRELVRESLPKSCFCVGINLEGFLCSNSISFSRRGPS